MDRSHSLGKHSNVSFEHDPRSKGGAKQFHSHSLDKTSYQCLLITSWISVQFWDEVESFPLPESDPPKIANYILFGAFSIAKIFRPHNGILTGLWLKTSRIWTRKAFSWILPDTSRSHRRTSAASWRRVCVISKRKSMCDNEWLFYRRWCFEGL